MNSSEENDNTLKDDENINIKEELLNQGNIIILEIVRNISEDISKFISNIIKTKLSGFTKTAKEKKDRITLLNKKKQKLLLQENNLTEENLLEDIALSLRMNEYLKNESDIQTSKITKINVYFTRYAFRALKLLKESFDWGYLELNQRIILNEKFIKEYRIIQKNRKYKSGFLRDEHEEKIKNFISTFDGKIINSLLNREEYKLANLKYERDFYFKSLILNKKKEALSLKKPDSKIYININNDYICKLEADLIESQGNVINKGNELVRVLDEAINHTKSVDKLNREEVKDLQNLVSMLEDIESTIGSYNTEAIQEKASNLKVLLKEKR